VPIGILPVCGASVMPRRLLSPVRTFDVVPPHIVEAAKRVFIYFKHGPNRKTAPPDGAVVARTRYSQLRPSLEYTVTWRGWPQVGVVAVTSDGEPATSGPPTS
jgi:hypothetical protein